MAPTSTDSTSAKAAARPPPNNGIGGEVKPRLTKEQHDILETRFLKENKPSTNAKKGLADMLNVPLEKVNNWFQNRRAKKKQDERKKQQSSQLVNSGFPHPFPVQYPPPMDQFNQAPQHPMGQHDLNWSTPNLSQSMTPIENSGPYGQQRFASSQVNVPQNFGQLHSINETSILGSSEVDSKAILQNFSSAGYPVSGDQTFFDLSRSQLAEFPNNAARFEYGRAMSSSDVSPGYAHTSFGNDSMTELSTYSTSANASMQALVEPHSMSSDLPPFAASHSATGSISSSVGNPMPVLNTGIGEWAGDENSPAPFSTGSYHEGSVEGSVGNLQQLDSTSPQDPAMWNFMGSSDMYMHSNNNSSHQVLQTTAEQGEGISIQVEPSGFDLNVPAPDEDFHRRTSSTSALADSMGNVGIEGSDISDDLKQPDRPGSSLYSRRQRPRPTTLKPNSLRSASYSSAGPASPRGVDSNNALRHVRSIGALPPRIQKPGTNSAPRSPRHFNLADANAAVNYQALNSPGLSNNGGTLAPPTPLSPNELAYQTSWANQGMAGSQSPGPQLGPDAMAVPWDSEPVASPPSTPGGHLRLGLAQRVSNGSMVKDTPPQSAPATQQTFPRSSFVQFSQPMQEPQLMMDLNNMQVPGRSHHMRRPSMPEGQENVFAEQQMKFQAPMGSLAGEMPMMYPMQYGNNTAMGQMTSMPGDLSMYSGLMSVPGNGPQAEFQVHQYRPPPGLHQQSSARQDNSMAKRSYTFSNQSPSDFNKSDE